jgi:hypothetical protein
MKYYSVAEIEMSDQGWVRTYIKDVTRMVEQRGGWYPARTSKSKNLKANGRSLRFSSSSNGRPKTWQRVSTNVMSTGPTAKVA